MVSHKRVLIIMRQASLLCQLRHRFRATTDSALIYEVPESRQRRGVRLTRADLALGHNPCPATDCFLQSGSNPGRLLGQLDRLVFVTLDRHMPYAFSTGDGALKPPAGTEADPSFGSRRRVGQRRVRSPVAECWRRHQHGSCGQPLRGRQNLKSFFRNLKTEESA